jgi:hypothetical protein
MPEETKDPKIPQTDESPDAKAEKDKGIKRAADEAAGKAHKTERRYAQRRGGTFPRGGPSGMA